MKGARKQAAPNEFNSWLNMENADWKPAYPFNEPSVRNSIIRSLLSAQRGLCVYCGKALDMSHPGKSFHIEHFRPQSTYPELSVSYDNLFLSCGQEDGAGKKSETCGTKKGEWFDEGSYVEPLYPSCTSRFKFLLNGNVVPSKQLDDAASNMINVLGLNHAELSKEREAVFLSLDSGELDPDDFLDQASGLAESFAHLAYQSVGKILP